MNHKLTPEQERRYMTDAEFHARVDVVSQALWNTVSTHDLSHSRPFPYDRLIPETKYDLAVYAVAAVEALEAFDAS